MRRKIVAGNWKMNLNYEEGLSVFSETVNMVQDEINQDVLTIVAAPYIHLSALVKLAERRVQIAAQNCHQQDAGAFTGEISATQLQSIGVSHVIIGHSERRQYFGESDELIAKKVDAALRNSLIPIVCIGELLEERNAGNYFSVIENQLTKATFHLPENQFKNLIIAYEPVWAIGTGLTATPEQAQEIHQFIRTKIAGKYGSAIAENTSILYGGSCNAQNAKALFAMPDIDGGLIGGASLKSRDFLTIIQSF